MRKPVVGVVGKYLRLLAPLRFHSPYLHVPRALGIKIDILPVRRIFRPVVEARRGRQSGFFAPGDWNCINVKLAVALPYECQRFPIGRPPVPVGRRILRNSPWCSTTDRHHVNDGFVLLLRLVADRQQRTVRRNSMVVVALVCKSRINRLWLSATYGEPQNFSIAIEQKGFAVAR